jgi:uncharacterized cupredoxin-like copper-binding protein
MTKGILAAVFVLMLVIAGGAYGHGGATNGKGGHAGGEHAFTFGAPGDPGKVVRTIEVEMNDGMKFVPDRIRVKRGETIRFRVRNVGAMKHEMVIGTLKELKAHAEMMRKFPEMEHADPNQVVVDPGKIGELVWHFTKSGNFDIGCLQPGHFEAGMVGTIRVKR